MEKSSLVRRILTRLGSYWRIWTGLALALLLCLLVVDCSTTSRMKSVEGTTVNPRGGEITITHRYRAPHKKWRLPEGFTAEFSYPEKNIEVIKVVKPTRFNKTFKLERRRRAQVYLLFGLFAQRDEIEVKTVIDEVTVETMAPAADSRPVPETMNNQIMVRFSSPLTHRFPLRENIQPADMTLAKLTPLVRGYYRFSDERTLTFNFAEDRPQFETTYTIELAPRSFLNKEDQIWTDTSTTFTFTTSPNEVEITNFSIQKEAQWSQNLNISFSGAMVDAFAVLKERSPPGFPVQIRPKTDGVWIWTNARTLQFRPNLAKGGWPIRKTVTVTVDPKINKEKDRTWRTGKAGDVLRFNVPPIPQRIGSLSPTHENVELDAPIFVRFSRDMVSKEQIRRPFQNLPTAPHIPITLEPAAKGRLIWTRPNMLEFHIDDIWKELTTYQVNLNPTYQPNDRYEWEGQKSYEFKTVENVLRFSAFLVPEDGLNPSEFYQSKSRFEKREQIPTESRLWIEFDREAGAHWPKNKDLKRALRFEPPVEGRFKWLGRKLLEFIPSNDWPEEQKISVTPTKDLLWHKEQHFAKEKESAEFFTRKNAVWVDLNDTRLPDQPVTISFSRNMKALLSVGQTYDLGSVRPESVPFTIQPKTAGKITWVTARELRFEAAHYLKPKTRYKVTINESILPRTQTKFHGTVFSFRTTKNDVNMSHFSPTGLVRGRVVIDAHFTKRIKPVGTEIGTKEMTGLFAIDPPLSGGWIWLADNKLQFKPKRDLQPATKYAVTFHPTKIANKELTWSGPKEKDKKTPKPVIRTFYTAPLRVQHVVARQLVNEENPLKQRLFLDFEFSEPVRAPDLKAKFSFWWNKRQVEVPITYKLDLSRSTKGHEGYDRVSVVSDWLDRPSYDRRIYYRIAKGLAPVVGTLPLAQEYKSDFLQEKPRKVQISRVDWRLDARVYTAELSLTAPVDPKRVEKNLKIFHGKKRLPRFSVTVASNASRGGRYVYTIAARFEPNKAYTFLLPERLLATDGAFAIEELKYTSTVPHLPSELDFALPGHVLARHQLKKVPVISTNRDSFYLYIHRIYPNNVRHFLNHSINRDISKIAKRVFANRVKTEADKDTPTVTHVNLEKLFDSNAHGMYRVCIGERYCQKQRWFIATDIGLMARRFDGNMVIWARSLDSAEPLADTQVSVVDAWNQTIANARTDSAGLASVRLRKGQVPKLVLAKRGNDLSFLSMALHKDPLKGFDTEGVSSKKETLRTFLYSDRGVYRPGETVHLVAVTRAQQGRLPNDYALEMLIRSPRGATVKSERFRTGTDGVFVHNFEVSPEARTGRWKASITWRGSTIGTYQFQVEEFIPAKLRVKVKADKERVFGGEELTFSVTGTNLFGPPASGNDVRAKVQLRANYWRPPGFETYWFGHEDTKFQRIDKQLEAQKLDDQGKATFRYAIPSGIVSPIGLQAHFSAEVIDDGGRAVASYGTADVLLYERFVGIKKLTQERLEIGKPVRFDLVNLYASGERVPLSEQQLELRAFREREITHYKKSERGFYRYVTEKELQPVKDLAQRDEQGRLVFLPEQGGNYLLEIEDRAGGQVTRTRFYVRDMRPDPLASREPDRIQLRLLTKKPKVGNNALVEVRAPFAGTLMLLGEQDELVYAKTMSVTQRPVEVEIPITKQHLPNFYLSATLIRSTRGAGKNTPIYATGLMNVTVIDPAQKPSLSITAPKRVAPNGTLDVAVQVGDLNNHEMYFTIAVVDEGILSLTGFKTPDMDQFFNHKQRLEVMHYEMYGMVLPYLPDAKSEVSPSGDAPSRALIKKRRVNPKAQERVKSVALWSGLLETDSAGVGRASFSIPDFDGQVRVMAVAFGDGRFVSGERNVTVRDKLVLKPSVPRFGAAGDEFVLPFKIFNGTELGGAVEARITVSDHLAVLGPEKRTLKLKPGESASSSFLLSVQDRMDAATIDLVCTGLSETTKKHYTLPLRAAGRLETRSGSGYVDKNAPITIDFPKDLIAESEERALLVSADPLVRFQNSLRYLVRYPHGCLEQTTSKAFPLIYYPALAKNDVGGSQRVGRYVKAAIRKIQQMQTEDGAFTYWPGGSSYNVWASIYAAHFLIEAKRASYKVSEATWNNMLVFLERVADDPADDLAQGVYASYVLALAEENVLSKLNYTYDEFGSQLKSQDKARLAAAFAVLKQKERAQEILSELSFSAYDLPYRRTGGNFGSHIRDMAITLDALVEVGSDKETIAQLTKQLIDASYGGRWGTTQENVFALLAMGKVYSSNIPSLTANVTLGSSPIQIKASRMFRTSALKSRSARIEVTGDGTVAYAWEAEGLPKSVKSLQQDQGLEVRRAWKSSTGKAVNLDNLEQGEVIVAEITITSDRSLDNVIISDLLPMGLEIENARLQTSTKLDWLEEQAKPDYVDIRDDRINLYTSTTGRKQTFYYAARAVTVGRFALPAIRAEAMYDPKIFSQADSGRARVVAAD